MTTSGNQLISDVQVVKNDLGLVQVQWKELLGNAEGNFTDYNVKFDNNIQELNKKTEETFQAVKLKFDETTPRARSRTTTTPRSTTRPR